MHLTVLGEPDCPNAPVLVERLAVVLDGRDGVSMSREVISDDGEAARRGMYGSPTLLIDEVDPFAEPGQTPSMSCRLYRDENGKLSGAPSLAQLREAVKRAAEAAGASDLTLLDQPAQAPKVGPAAGMMGHDE